MKAKGKTSQEKKAHGTSPEKTRCQFPGAPTHGVVQSTCKSHSNTQTRCVNVLVHYRPQCPRFCLQAARVSFLCLACTKIPDSRRKVSFQDKQYCVHRQFGGSDPLLGKVSHQRKKMIATRVPTCQPRWPTCKYNLLTLAGKPGRLNSFLNKFH